MSSSILDASALLALVNQEPGAEEVSRAISRGALISSVNLSEAAGKLYDSGMPEALVRQVLDLPGVQVVDFNIALAHRAGMLRPLTRQYGLSLADRACLALGQQSGLPVFTADSIWAELQVGVAVKLIR